MLVNFQFSTFNFPFERPKGVKNVLDSLKLYLEKEGICGIFLDFMPPVEKQTDAVGLFEWNSTIPEYNYSGGVHYIQIQVRRSTYDEAKEQCRKIFDLLDSGTDERVIDLSDEIFCIGRPRRGALLLDRGCGSCTFYCEVALWCNCN